MVLALLPRAIFLASLCSPSRADSFAGCSANDVDDALAEEASLAQVTLLSSSHQMFRFHIDGNSEATVAFDAKATSLAIKDVLDKELLNHGRSESGIEFMAHVQKDEEEQMTIAGEVLKEAAESGIASYAGTAKMSDPGQIRKMEEQIRKLAAEEEASKLKVEGATASFFPDIAKVLRNESADSSLDMPSLDTVVSQAIETEYKMWEHDSVDMSHQEYLDYVKTADGEDAQEEVAKIALKELTGLQVDLDQKPEVELLLAMEAEVVKVAASEEKPELSTASEMTELAKDSSLDGPTSSSDSIRKAEGSPQVASGFSVAKEASSVVTGGEGGFAMPF